MAGQPAGSGNPNIFGRVQASLVDFLGQLDPGTTVFVAPFADGIKDFKQFSIGGQAGQAASYVEGLSANGSSTHVYDSLLGALSQYESFREGQSNRRVGVVVVYTDGKDNGPAGRSMADVVDEFGLARQPDDFLYYSTLGVELSPQDRAALEASPFAAYNPSESGEVTPLRVIEPRYPLLDFSNLLTAPETTRQLPFDVRSQGGLPAGTRLIARASFPTIAQAGAAVEVEGGPFDPTSGDPAELRLRLVNVDPGSIEQRMYEGTIQFESTQPGVLALPVRARFRYQPARTVAPPEGGVRAIDLGKFNPYERGGRASGVTTIPLRFNAEALSKDGSYSVVVEPAGVLPLDPSHIIVNGSRGRLSYDVSVNGGVPLEFGVVVDSTVAPGDYTGVLVVESGPDVEAERFEIPWSVEVSEPPRTLAEWVVLIIGGLLALALLVFVVGGLLSGVWPFWKRPTLRGELVVIRGANGPSAISIRGKEHVSVGAGTPHLADASGRLTVRAEYVRKGLVAHQVAKVVSEEGAVLRKKPGERRASSFGSEPLADQDQFEIAPYTLEYVAY